MNEFDRVKLPIAFLTAVALDSIVIGQPNMTRSAMYGASVVAGILSENTVLQGVAMVVPGLEKAQVYQEKSYMQRVAELGSVALSTHVVDKYVLQDAPNNNQAEFVFRLGCSAFSDFVAQQVAEWVTSKDGNTAI